MFIWFIVSLLVLRASSSSVNIMMNRVDNLLALEANNLSNIPPSEMQALYELYTSTNGDEWQWRNIHAGAHWDFTLLANPCVQNWQGINCTFVTPYQHISEINLDDYNLVGTIPSSISNLTHLAVLKLSVNSINGTLPSSMGDMTSLRSLDLMFNDINGTIPHSLGNITHLETLILLHNKFSGSIPDSFGQWLNISELILSGNKLTGHIPSTLCNATTLTVFEAFENDLSGHLPDCIGTLHRLKNLNFFHNRLSGTVPDLSGLVSLNGLTLGFNSFDGSLPASLSTLTHLIYIDLFNNELTGTVPESYGSMSQLEVLYLNHNHLVGVMDMLCDNTALEQLYLEDNHFTGTIPACFGAYTAMENLYLNNNHLFGTMPTELGDLQALIYFDVDTNILTGCVPSSYGTLNQLTFLYMYNNKLSGSLPVSLSQLSSLKYLFIENNHFTGALNHVFNASVQLHLHSIQLSGNAFTGDIPEQPFLTTTFTSLIAVDNCMHGSLPVVICNAHSLQVLVLDGMGTSSTCRDQILPVVSHSYMETHAISGGVPACLFAMHNLTTLHLSGNGLTGSLPPDLQLGDCLIDLAMSHNLLTGHIPAAIQQRVWYQLDLSYNRLSDSLSPLFSTVTNEFTMTKSEGVLVRSIQKNITTNYLSLQNNRISGKIPSTIKPLTDLSILEGNMFACNFEQTDLPEHDSAIDSYTCGSNQFNAQIYAWLSLNILVITVIFCIYKYENIVDRYVRVAEYAQYVRQWYGVYNIPEVCKMRNFRYVMDIADSIGKVTVWLTIVIVVVCVPLYVVCSKYYGTVTHQYAWSVSFIYQSGVVPFVLTFITYVGIVIFVLVLMQMCKRKLLSVVRHSISEERHTHHVFEQDIPRSRIYIAYASFFTINFSIVLGVNIAFVYITLYESNQMILVAQWVLSLFKDIWNSIGALYLMRWCFHTVASNETSGADFINTQLFVALFNNIAIPCLVVAAVSPDCFYNLFVLAPTIHVLYVYLQCGVFVGDTCLFYLPSLAATSYTPPFTYSYQCGAQYILAYAPTFVYLAIEVAFMMPAAQWFAVMLHKRATPGTRWFRFLDYWMFMRASGDPEHTGPVHRDPFEPYFDVTQLLVQLMTYLGIVLTFGVVFPPLAVVMMAAIVSLIITNKLVMGRFISNALEYNVPQYLEAIELDSQHLSKLRTSAWMLVWFACWFYALFLFDTLGNKTGLYGAMWVFIVLPLLPVGLYLLYEMHHRNISVSIVNKKQGSVASEVNTENDVEMRSIVENPLSKQYVEEIVNIEK